MAKKMKWGNPELISLTGDTASGADAYLDCKPGSTAAGGACTEGGLAFDPCSVGTSVITIPPG